MLGRRQARVVLVARTLKELTRTAELVRREGGEALVVRGDVSREADVERLFDKVSDRWGAAQVLVNNAGIGIYGPVATYAARDFDQVLAVNLRGTFLCCRAALRQMMPVRRGTIINISSVVGIKGYANQAAYTAAKHGVMGLTKSLAAEAQPHGIRVSVILPGAVDTPMVRKARPDLNPGELLQTEDVAQAVEYLLSLADRAAVDELYIRRRASRPF